MYPRKFDLLVISHHRFIVERGTQGAINLLLHPLPGKLLPPFNIVIFDVYPIDGENPSARRMRIQQMIAEDVAFKLHPTNTGPPTLITDWLVQYKLRTRHGKRT